MTLRVLVVEDDDSFVDALKDIVTKLPGRSNIRVARSRDDAFSELDGGFVDLVILDLSIPAVTGGLDPQPVHGRAVFNRIRTSAPGTPIFVLTGSPAEEFLYDSILAHQQQIDIWSEGQPTGTIQFKKKYNIDECYDVLAPMARAINGLSDIEIDREGLSLSESEDRLIRIFAKRVRGARCVISELSGGLSGARVVRLRVTDTQGVQLHDAVAKLSTHMEVRGEGDRYDKYIARLDPIATPRKLAILEYGAHKLAGIFFGLAVGLGESVFDIVHSARRAESVIQELRRVTAPWSEGVPETRRSIGELRRRLLDDESLRRIQCEFSLGWISEFEERMIQTRWTCGHGDLHGKNVLVSEAGVALIDYSDVGFGPASLDPITLELSLLFHPRNAHRDSAWPSAEMAERWGDVEAYARGCPYERFVHVCRGWARQVGAGNREIAASAYAYLLRQLKYADTDKRLALSLLEGVVSFYDAST